MFTSLVPAVIKCPQYSHKLESLQERSFTLNYYCVTTLVVTFGLTNAKFQAYCDGLHLVNIKVPYFSLWWQFKAVLSNFSTAFVNLLCFDLSFALRGFTNQHLF